MRPNNFAVFFFIIALFLFIGCDKKDIVSPVEDSGSISPFSSDSGPAWISLPEKSEFNQSGESTVTKFVRADRREFVTVSRKIEGGKLGSFRVACVIVIPEGALEKDENITMTIDEKKGFVTILPEMEFNIPAKFTMILKGLNLENIKSKNIDFVSFDDSRGIKEINSQRMKIDRASGTIGVYEAVIQNSSTYGFTE
jgi:hypothetical protein